jgi:hypothetical protein
MSLFDEIKTAFQGTSKDERLLQPIRQILQDPHVLTFGAPKDEWNALVGLASLLMGLMGVGRGIVGLLGKEQAQGSPWAGVIIGAVFALFGYGMVCYVSHHVTFDLLQRCWHEQAAGIRPFALRIEGALEEWKQVRFAREERTESDEAGGYLTYEVWAVSLIARDRRRPPLALPWFEFPCQVVERVDATALAQQFAHRLTLPLHEADTEHVVEHFAAGVATEVHGAADLRQGSSSGPRE